MNDRIIKFIVYNYIIIMDISISIKHSSAVRDKSNKYIRSYVQYYNIQYTIIMSEEKGRGRESKPCFEKGIGRKILESHAVTNTTGML